MATSSALEQIPADAICTFVGEGRANIVFTLSLANDGNNCNLFQGQLLRLPKQQFAHKALPYADIQHYWETTIKPLFAPTDLVQQRLVRLPSDKAFHARLNAQLRELDASGSRRADFVGHTVGEQDDHDGQLGMLVEDMRSMSSSKGDNEVPMHMHEIKPKWLHQSPRAPPGAQQCRNCAREVWRNMQNATHKPVFCPLNLVRAADFPGDEGVACEVAAELQRCFGNKGMTEAEAVNLTRWLRSCGLFQRLRRIQWDCDHCAEVPGDDERYALAMTLRDCSLFVLVPSTPPGDGAESAQVVAKLGDTDRKNSKAKKEYWMRMEKDFHDSGVYWKTDELSLNLTACQLPFYRDRMGDGADSELGRYYSL